MCGIFGYIGEGKNDLSGFLLQGLEQLEYRGYDSAGIAIIKNPHPLVFKEVGGVANLAQRIKGKSIDGGMGIGHTRWATHGGVAERNAHPHLDCTSKVVVVHNGIVENFNQLKKELENRKHKIVSETDTEIIAHLIEEELRKLTGKHKKVTPKQFAKACFSAFKRVEGLNAVVAGSVDSSCLVAWRRGSPLIVGVQGKNFLISSDLPVLTSYTQRALLLDDKEGALLSKDGLVVFDKLGRKKRARFINFHTRSQVGASKGRCKHFMLKEIREQPEVLARIASYPQDLVVQAARMIKNAFGTYFTACGTAAHAGLAATYFFSDIAKRHVNFAVGSEFYFLEEFLKPRSLLIAASQSGETMDTLEAVRAARRHRSNVVSLVNVPGSTLFRASDFSLELMAGPEKAVVSTKAYLAKLGLFLLLAFALDRRLEEGFRLLRKTQRATSRMFEGSMERKVKQLAKKLRRVDHIFLIGRGVNYATALEGALKIKESSYVHAEGFAGGELKHGVIALIEKGTPCIVFVGNDESKEEVLSNAQELSSRGALIIGIGPKKEEVFDEWIEVPDVGEASPIVNVIPAQLLAYYLAVQKGLNPDKPRNLAKSVTVK